MGLRRWGVRIKQIELLGFKSFKDKTVFSFPAGITAIVGPNGCGKSNVVDALRWVLGEQSVRHLRGHEMGDVVFAGTAGNTPLGMAEVNLLLENTGPQISVPEGHTNGVANGSNGAHINGANGGGEKIEENPGENIPALSGDEGDGGNGISLGNWTEMMVSRRYFRSGESEYLLNKIPCRLRDIVEFFLGTGAGTKAYAIIEQGRVDHLINAKPDEIRVLIEEAAGVSLYRSRRLAAERKLERTQDNLARVADLLHEMERQLGSLRRQAKKADQYQTLQEELKVVDLTLLCKAYQTLRDELETLDARRNEVVQEDQRLSHEVQQLQAERAQALTVLEEEERTLRASEERCHILESSLQQGEQRKQFFVQQEQRAADRAIATETELSGLEERQALVHNDIESLSLQASQSQQALHEEESVLQAQEQENAGLQQALLQSEAATEEYKTGIVDLLTQEAQVQNSLAYSRRRAAEVEQRLHVLSGEAERISGVLAETEQRLSSTQSQAAQLRERLLIGQRQRVEKTDGLREVVSVGEQLEQELAAAWAKQAELRTRLSTLEEMEQGYERYAPGVQSIMADMADGAKKSHNGTSAQVLGVVAQMLAVPHTYERAVAAVLREKLEYVVVADVGDGLAAVEYLRTAEAGHGSFIPRQPRKTDRGQGLAPQNSQSLTVGQGSAVAISAPLAEESQGTPLLSFLSIELEYRDVIETLLEDTVLVPDLQTGLRLWNSGHNGHNEHENNGHTDGPTTFVTLEGEVLSAEGVVSGGSEGFAEEGLLERRREIRDLHQQVEEHEHVVSGLVGRRQEAKLRQQELEGELARLEAEARALGEESETLQREAGQLEGEQRRLLDKKESTSYERQTLDEEQHTLGTEIETLSARAAEIGTQRQEQEIQLAEKQAEVAQAKVALEQQRSVCDNLRIRVAERRERHEGMRAQQVRLQEQQRELAERLASRRAERDAAQGEGEKIRTALAELADRLVQQAEDLSAAAQEQETRRESCAQLRTTCREYEEQIEQGRAAQAEFQEEKTRLEVGIAEKRVSGEHLDTTVQERYEVSIRQVLSQYVEGDIEIEDGEQRRQDLRNKLARLGEVNPGAASELSEIEERHTFLKSQESDLDTSITDLQSTITKLNRESRDRFKETFTLVDEKFRAVYERLVEGGKAEIALTDENDLTNSGVEISIQPPGKRLRSLQLLSGGEKALAALSFTFALFLIRPSPFCVLDEVDAPLDDANVGRFNQLVREMSASTQVVLITHNKRTMEAASTLYGVTMQEPGVSTVVSVSMS